MAASVFSQMGKIMSLLSSHVRRVAFKTILSQAVKVYPNHLKETLATEPDLFVKSHYVSPSLFQSRIYLLAALSAFLASSDVCEPSFMDYLDTIWVAILQVNAHPLLQATVLKIINESLPRTNGNRLKVEKIFRPLVHLAIQDSKAHPLLLFQTHQFFSTWYTKPSDEVLESMQTVEKLSQGYAQRRKCYLTEQQYPVERNEHDLMLEKAKKVVDTEETRVQMAKKASISLFDRLILTETGKLFVFFLINPLY
jgi:hypothetical protein